MFKKRLHEYAAGNKTQMVLSHDDSIIVRKTSHSNLGRAASPPLTHRIPKVTMGCPTFTLKLPLPFDDLYPRLIYSFLDRPHSPPQTVSRSNQPFCHSTPSGQTDGQTDGIYDKSVPTPAYTLLTVGYCDAAKKEQQRPVT